MNELDFYNQQFEKYKKYDRKRYDDETLDLERAEDYFLHLVRSYSDPKGTLVDLGCGDGYFSAKLVDFNGSVIGIEPSSLINAANALLEEEQQNNLTFLQEDAYKLPFNDGSVELVISRRGPDPQDEIFRVLKNEGLFIFITIGENDGASLKEHLGRGQHFSSVGRVSDKLKARFSKAGFTEIRCKEFLYEDDFTSNGDLKEFLHQVPICTDFSPSDYSSVDEYCKKYTDSSIKLERHRVVMLARK